MRIKARDFIEKWREDYHFKTLSSSAFSALLGVAFMVTNGVLGVVYRSLWHGSIFVYYFLLTGIRAVIVISQLDETARSSEKGAARRRRVYILTHALLLLMDVSLFVPVSVRVMGGRSYTYGLIPAIIMAAYTTLRVSLSVMNFKKSRKSENILVSELRMISFTDSLLAVLSLQNALIIANGGTGRAMMTLSAWTSAGILAAILVITVLSFAGIRKRDG